MDFDFGKKKILYDKEVSVKKQYFMFEPLCGTCTHIHGIKEIKFLFIFVPSFSYK